MRSPRAGSLDRRIQFRRATEALSDLGTSETWGNHGTPVYASRQDVRDSEKWAAGQVSATTMSRFVVRWSSFIAGTPEMPGITAKDRFTCDGRDWDVMGVKEIGRREWLEITATSESD